MGSHPMVKPGMKKKAKDDSILNLSRYNPRACLIMTGCRKCCKDEKLGKSKEVPRAATPGAARLADGQGPTQPMSQLCNHKEEPPGDPRNTHLFFFFSPGKSLLSTPCLSLSLALTCPTPALSTATLIPAQTQPRTFSYHLQEALAGSTNIS